jgi:ketosteroid isomerase-like protein
VVAALGLTLATCGGSNEHTEKGDEMSEAREVIDRVTQAAMRGDVTTLGSLYADDAVIETPDQGTIREPDAIVEWSRAFRTAFPDMSWEPLHEHEAGNTAIDEGFVAGTHTGPLESPDGQIPATGKRLRLRMSDAVTVKSGLVTSHRFYFDQLELLGQLGLAPEGSHGRS